MRRVSGYKDKEFAANVEADIRQEPDWLPATAKESVAPRRQKVSKAEAYARLGYLAQVA